MRSAIVQHISESVCKCFCSLLGQIDGMNDQRILVQKPFIHKDVEVSAL